MEVRSLIPAVALYSVNGSARPGRRPVSSSTSRTAAEPTRRTNARK
ncbi:hypothetical protein [Kitasatospora sp. NPDC001132]